MKKPTKPKDSYKVTNWKEYNQNLCKRGSMTMWIGEDIEETWYYKGSRNPGGEVVYSDVAIECCLTFRALFSLGYRQTQGFVESLFSLSGSGLKAPCYSQIQRRAKHIDIDIKVSTGSSAPIDIVLDSTGLKVYGEGEWKVRRHGKDKNRTWRKVHIGSNPSNLEIVSVKVTGNNIDDASAGIDLIKQIKEPIERCAGDGAYDKKKFRGCLPANTTQLIPPQRNAVISKENDPALIQRDKAIRRIRKVGRDKWKEETGYHIRSLSEVNMYRYKKIFTGDLKARKPENEVNEVRIKCKILNRFIEIGMPKSIKIAA